MFILRILLVVIALTIPAVAAPFTWDISAVNTTGGDVYDIHVLISGTGGSIANLVAVNPAVQNLNSPNGNDIDADWAVALPNNGTWRARFTTDFGPLTVVSAYWTDINHNNIGGLAAGDVIITPEPSSIVLLSTAGVFFLVHRRRRA
jgi:hypothetical protein